jgi:hypothetical protein
MNWLSKRFAVAPLVIVALMLTSCSLISSPSPNEADVIGVWKSEGSQAVITLKKDMTFEARNIPAGFAYVIAPDGAEMDIPLAFKGDWELRPVDGRPSVLLHFDLFEPHGYKFLDMRFAGARLAQLYLTKGDPDQGHFLNFARDTHNG